MTTEPIPARRRALSMWRPGCGAEVAAHVHQRGRSMTAARCTLLVLVLLLGQAGPAPAATIRLSTSITTDSGAYDNNLFPDEGRRAECQPSCFSQATRTDALEASILSATLSGHQSYGTASMFIDVSGRARVGDLGLSVTSFTGGAIRSKGIAEGFGTASWLDVIRITTDAVALGEELVIEASLNLFGILDAIATGHGSAGAGLSIADLATPSLLPSPHGGTNWGQTIYDLGRNLFIDRPVVDVLPVHLTIANGARVPLGYSMSLGSSAESDIAIPNQSVPGTTNVNAIAINSLHWGGIHRVSDHFGNTIANFTVESDSGFDFSRPFGGDVGSVPEPGPASLMLAALGAGWASRRHGGNSRKRSGEGCRASA